MRGTLEMKRRYFKATLLGLIAQSMIIFAVYSSFGRSDAASQQASDRGYSTDIKELHDKFNKDKGNVRLLLLLSPTCPECLRGASEIQSKVLEKIKDSDMRVYVIYLPILKMDREESVPSAMKVSLLGTSTCFSIAMTRGRPMCLLLTTGWPNLAEFQANDALMVTSSPMRRANCCDLLRQCSYSAYEKVTDLKRTLSGTEDL